MDRLEEIATLQRLMERIYLSTACASGNHRDCRLVDKYRGLVCCCPTCDHEGRSPKNDLLTGPLLHHAETVGERRPGYIYRGSVGRRIDLIRLATSVMLRARAVPQDAAMCEIADQIALHYAPRLG